MKWFTCAVVSGGCYTANGVVLVEHINQSDWLSLLRWGRGSSHVLQHKNTSTLTTRQQAGTSYFSIMSNFIRHHTR